MTSTQPIAKSTFQAYALSLLVLWLGLVAYWTIADCGPFRWACDELRLEGLRKGFATVITFVALFPVWLLLVLPVRRRSEMPTLRQELGVGLSDGLPAVFASMKRSYQTEKQKNEQMYSAKDYTPEMKSRARRIGAALLLIGIVLTPLAIWTTLLSAQEGFLFDVQIAFVITAPTVLVMGLIQLIRGKPVLRR